MHLDCPVLPLPWGAIRQREVEELLSETRLCAKGTSARGVHLLREPLQLAGFAVWLQR